MRHVCLPYLTLFAALLFLSSCKPKTEPAPVTNISSTLSFSTNPSGNLQVGYSAGSTLDVNQFQLCGYADVSHVIGIWHPGMGSSAYYPYTGQNNTDSAQLDPTASWAARPGEVVMEGSNTGQYSMLRFTAPAAGNYKVKVIFEGVHFRLSTTDVHVLLNNQSLFADSISGYGGDPLFHAIQGARPSVTYSDTVHLSMSDVVTFAVGYGSDNTNYNDTTGLLIVLELVG